MKYRGFIDRFRATLFISASRQGIAYSLRVAILPGLLHLMKYG